MEPRRAEFRLLQKSVNLSSLKPTLKTATTKKVISMTSAVKDTFIVMGPWRVLSDVEAGFHGGRNNRILAIFDWIPVSSKPYRGEVYYF
jgi:hypothetical protein